MTSSPQPSQSRRNFLSAAAAATAGITLSGIPVGPSTGAAAAVGPRSLVCVFLAGGADSFNMYIPADHDEPGKTYDTYADTRGAFAVSAAEVRQIGDGQFGLHPSLPGLASLADRNRLAVVANVGPLGRPLSNADVGANRSQPQGLFAHNAQQKLWQTARSSMASDQGWGGAVAAALDDAAAASQSPALPLTPAFSLSGSNIWQSSLGSSYSRLSASVRVGRLMGYDASLRGWIPSFGGVQNVLLASLDAAARATNQLEQAASGSIRTSITATDRLQTATAPSAANEVGMDEVGGNPLGLQLRMVARLIKNREALGMPRQVFFVRLGGFDTHRSQQQILPILLSQLDRALASFHTALDMLGVADTVTTFTASDFGRTLTSNGDGTDHGWGGHGFVMGGAVKAGRYGTFPSYATQNNPDDVSDSSEDFAGRLIPTTSVSQYGATLATWMGLSKAQIASAFPDLANFSQKNLGFL